jgi:hypothetical protein
MTHSHSETQQNDQSILDFSAFMDWIAGFLDVAGMDPDETVEVLVGGDWIRWYELLQAFDSLMGHGGRPHVELARAATPREIYWHYAYASSAPAADESTGKR